MTKNKKQHIDFIDLAKGFCILLVVFLHVSTKCNVDYEFNQLLSSFRMPLYFILSGLFFKEYSGFYEFIRHKANRLLIPFIFFYLITSVLLFNIIIATGDSEYIKFNHLAGFKAIFSLYYEDFYNVPIWFLWCLFIINILFYSLCITCKRIVKYRLLWAGILSFSLGLFGLYLSKEQINIPLFFDTSFTCLPFFYVGYMLKRTNLLYPNKYDQYNWLIILFCAFVVYKCYTHCDYRANTFQNVDFNIYICGVLGTITILLLAKKIKHMPLLSYIGRFSIMTLCTHKIILRYIYAMLHSFTNNEFILVLGTFVLTCTVCALLIPLMKKYIPYFTAQKELLVLT